LAHFLHGQRELLLQISAGAPGIVEIQLRILQLLGQTSILSSKASLNVFTVYQ
jgi:hypothetical protein